MRVATKLITWTVVMAIVPLATLPVGQRVSARSTSTGTPKLSCNLVRKFHRRRGDQRLRVIVLVKKNLSNSLPLGQPMLTGPAPSKQITVSGQTFQWSDGIICHPFAVGDELITRYQRIYGNDFLLGDGIVENSAGQLIDPNRLTFAVSLVTRVITSDGETIGEGTPFLDLNLQLGDGLALPDGIMVGDGITVGDGIMVGDTLQSAETGDETAFMRRWDLDRSQRRPDTSRPVTLST